MKNEIIKICIVEDDDDVRRLTKDVIEMDNQIKVVEDFACRRFSVQSARVT